MAKDIPYGTRDLAISPKSAKLPSKEQEKSTKSHAKDRLPGWMVPGQKHLCHLALSMPGVGCILYTYFAYQCIPYILWQERSLGLTLHFDPLGI